MYKIKILISVTISNEAKTIGFFSFIHNALLNISLRLHSLAIYIFLVFSLRAAIFGYLCFLSGDGYNLVKVFFTLGKVVSTPKCVDIHDWC